jgi:hypothetical protein
MGFIEIKLLIVFAGKEAYIITQNRYKPTIVNNQFVEMRHKQ